MLEGIGCGDSRGGPADARDTVGGATDHTGGRGGGGEGRAALETLPGGAAAGRGNDGRRGGRHPAVQRGQCLRLDGPLAPGRGGRAAGRRPRRGPGQAGRRRGDAAGGAAGEHSPAARPPGHRLDGTVAARGVGPGWLHGRGAHHPPRCTAWATGGNVPNTSWAAPIRPMPKKGGGDRPGRDDVGGGRRGLGGRRDGAPRVPTAARRVEQTGGAGAWSSAAATNAAPSLGP